MFGLHSLLHLLSAGVQNETFSFILPQPLLFNRARRRAVEANRGPEFRSPPAPTAMHGPCGCCCSMRPQYQITPNHGRYAGTQRRRCYLLATSTQETFRRELSLAHGFKYFESKILRPIPITPNHHHCATKNIPFSFIQRQPNWNQISTNLRTQSLAGLRSKWIAVQIALKHTYLSVDIVSCVRNSPLQFEWHIIIPAQNW